MILISFIIIGLITLLITSLSRSDRWMNIWSIMQSGSYLFLSVFALLNVRLPIFFGKNHYFFMDSLALYEVTIASFIFLLASLYLSGYIWSLVKTKELNPKNIKLFYLSMNLLLSITALSFFSNNLALFWIFLELTTLLSAVLIVILNAKENIYATLKYVFIASTSMLFSFIGLILLYMMTLKFGNGYVGTLNWTEIMQFSAHLPAKTIIASFMFIFMGFAAKSGIAPFHTWLPHAHAKAPSAVSAVLSGVLLNIGIYGIIRIFAIGNQTAAKSTLSWFLISFGMLTVFFAAFSMLRQSNLKKLIAFSSVEHMGIILIGIGIATQKSILASLLYILAHSLIKSLLFFCAGIVNRQYESNEASSIRNLAKLQPLVSFGLILGSFGIVGFPPFVLFMPKLLLLIEVTHFSLILSVIMIFLMLIAISGFAIFITRIFSSVYEADKKFKITRYKAPFGMKISIIILIFAIILFGLVVPDRILNIIGDIVKGLMF